MKILVCDPIAKEAVESMKKAGLDVTEKTGMSPEELLQVVNDYNVLIVRSATKVRRNVIETAKNLKIVFRGGVGLDNIDQEAAKEHGVQVWNTPGASSASVAELAVGYMFALARMTPQSTASMKAGKWEKKKFKGTEISGKNLGLLGFGRIAREVAKRAVALGMKVIAFDPYVKSSEIPGAEIGSFDDVITKAHYISLHMPLTDETKHMLNADTFSKMQEGVRIVHCARGGIIDENALYDAVKSGRVAGAALDVFEKEPAENNRLFELEQVIGSPHVGASTKEGQFRVGMEIAERLIAELSGKQASA